MYRKEIGEILFPVFIKYNARNAVLFGYYAKGTQDEKATLTLQLTADLPCFVSSDRWKM